jgi:hypothetical protein
MTLPAEVKMELERKALDLGARIVGVHSVYLVDNDTVDVIFDIDPDPAGNGLHFQFLLPQFISRNDLREFSEWLAEQGCYVGMTIH